MYVYIKIYIDIYICAIVKLGCVPIMMDISSWPHGLYTFSSRNPIWFSTWTCPCYRSIRLPSSHGMIHWIIFNPSYGGGRFKGTIQRLWTVVNSRRFWKRIFHEKYLRMSKLRIYLYIDMFIISCWYIMFNINIFNMFRNFLIDGLKAIIYRLSTIPGDAGFFSNHPQCVQFCCYNLDIIRISLGTCVWNMIGISLRFDGK